MCGRKSMKLKVNAGDTHRKRCWTTFSMLREMARLLEDLEKRE
jgi:hypothetical protein